MKYSDTTKAELGQSASHVERSSPHIPVGAFNSLCSVLTTLQTNAVEVVAWCSRWEPLGTSLTSPDMKFLDRAARRRLSKLTKVSLYLAHRCVQTVAEQQAEKGGNQASLMPACVFASRHGESQVTLNLFNDIRAEEMLSPLEFSRSVHNTSAGLYSIAAKNISAVTALAAGDDTVAMGLLEAIQLLQSGDQPVLLVYADAEVPEMYHRFLDESLGCFGLALMLTRLDESSGASEYDFSSLESTDQAGVLLQYLGDKYPEQGEIIE